MADKKTIEAKLNDGAKEYLSTVVDTLWNAPLRDRKDMARAGTRACDAAEYLQNAFTWKNSVEGHAFWFYVYRRLQEIGGRKVNR